MNLGSRAELPCPMRINEQNCWQQIKISSKKKSAKKIPLFHTGYFHSEIVNYLNSWTLTLLFVILERIQQFTCICGHLHAGTMIMFSSTSKQRESHLISINSLKLPFVFAGLCNCNGAFAFCEVLDNPTCIYSTIINTFIIIIRITKLLSTYQYS